MATKMKGWNENYKRTTGHYFENMMNDAGKEGLSEMNAKYGLNLKPSDITGNPADDEVMTVASAPAAAPEHSTPAPAANAQPAPTGARDYRYYESRLSK
jgi:hypothetical protein